MSFLRGQADWLAALVFAVAALCFSAGLVRAEDPALVVGPNECAECHKKEAAI
ncbi:hypothetical protein [Breoghania sp.]|uniref:hypothetical protein n=1 Tax=Breoghania sp. TaxID=2065378 RepID=UPI0026214B5F|nr:hypothetical protein [Breoghania sp.]MDJ0932206.1 hypothetical protein [Breoghania sp.]